MTSKLDTEEAPTELRRRRVFRTRVWIGAGAFYLAYFALYQWGQHGPAPLRLTLALLPLLAVAWLVVAMTARIRQLDEYQIKLQIPGLAVGFATMIVASIAMNAFSEAGFRAPDSPALLSLIGVTAWAFTSALTGAARN
ncbi:MAG: hypothetical protein FWD85_05145 [Microbacteriaceae bacterium]|nr:hypothetical protein [Microbacteriaceae bacterium]MCL2794676.1 hypothetical protein [Microbacteriaceae bacterium]